MISSLDSMFLLCNLVMGVCVAAASYLCRDSYGLAVGRVQDDLALRLTALRMKPAHLRRWLNLWIVLVLAVFFTLWLMFDSIVFALLALVLLSAGPWYLVYRLARARKEKLEDQMADAMVTFSSGVRAGLSLPQALQLLAEECPRPINQEFQQIVGEYKLGKPLETTLEEAKVRLQSDNFVLFAAALMASRAAGGKLNETVERIAISVREMQRLERKIKSETAQARKSAVYMAMVPIFLLVVYAVIDPVNTRLLFVTLPGQLLLATSIVLNLIAYFWALKILNPDI